MPMMSTPSSVTSPTMQAILVVPMSRPTMISLVLGLAMVAYESFEGDGDVVGAGVEVDGAGARALGVGRARPTPRRTSACARRAAVVRGSPSWIAIAWLVGDERERAVRRRGGPRRSRGGRRRRARWRGRRARAWIWRGGGGGVGAYVVAVEAGDDRQAGAVAALDVGALERVAGWRRPGRGRRDRRPRRARARRPRSRSCAAGCGGPRPWRSTARRAAGARPRRARRERQVWPQRGRQHPPDVVGAAARGRRGSRPRRPRTEASR